MQSIAEKILTEAADALSITDRRNLSQVVQQSRVDKPLWDRQPIQHRASPSSVQAVDEGDHAPASWEQSKDACMPATPAQLQPQRESNACTSVQSQDSDTRGSPVCGVADSSIGTGPSASGMITPQASTTAGSITAAELEAKMAELKGRIAARKAAAAAAAKAHSVPLPTPADASTANSREEAQASAAFPTNAMPLPAKQVTRVVGSSASVPLRPPKVSGSIYSSSMSQLHRPDERTGRQPTSTHSHQQPQVPHKQDRHLSESTAPAPDFSQSQPSTAASTHISAPPNCSLLPHASGQAVADTASQGAALAADAASKQYGQAAAGQPVTAAPVSSCAFHTSAQDIFTTSPPVTAHSQQVQSDSLPPMSVSLPSLRSIGRKHVEEGTQNRQSSQTHFDPAAWPFFHQQNARVPPDAKASASKHPHATASNHFDPSQPPEQQAGLHRPDKRASGGSHAAAAVAATAKRVDVMNNHMPHVLRYTVPTIMDADSNFTSAMSGFSMRPYECMTIDSAQARDSMPAVVASEENSKVAPPYPRQNMGDGVVDQRPMHMSGSPAANAECVVPMDFDAMSPRSHVRTDQMFGDPPMPAFGHMYNTAPRAHEAACCTALETAAPAVAPQFAAAVMHDGACSDDMDIEEDACMREG